LNVLFRNASREIIPSVFEIQIHLFRLTDKRT
jgi:hypothetical protein